MNDHFVLQSVPLPPPPSTHGLGQGAGARRPPSLPASPAHLAARFRRRRALALPCTLPSPALYDPVPFAAPEPCAASAGTPAVPPWMPYFCAEENPAKRFHRAPSACSMWNPPSPRPSTEPHLAGPRPVLIKPALVPGWMSPGSRPLDEIPISVAKQDDPSGCQRASTISRGEKTRPRQCGCRGRHP